MPKLQVCTFSEDEMMLHALKFAHYDDERISRVSRKTNVQRFKRKYGSNPCVYIALWKDIQLIRDDAYRLVVKNPVGDLKAFFLAIHFLRKYTTGANEEAVFGWSKRTCRKKKWEMIKRFQYMKETKIVWPKEWEVDPSSAEFGDIPIFLVSVDGFHCEIQEPSTGTWSKNPEYYSHKFHKAALAYEVALSVYQNKVVHINGPFKASTQDTTIFKGGVRKKIPKGRRAVVDNGYKGKDKKTSKPNPLDQPHVRKFKRQVRSRQECFNTRLKTFKCLKEQFCHGEEKHRVCFEATAVICQYQLKNGSPLFDV